MVNKLFEQSNGDIRSILNTLQLGCFKKNDTSKNVQISNIFETTGNLFSMETSFDDKIKYYWMLPDMHTLMIQENYINNTLATKDNIKCLQNIYYSAHSLSDADLFDSTFDFELAPYVAINTIKATIKCNKKGFVKFPQFLNKISTINKNKKNKLNYETINLFSKVDNSNKKKNKTKNKTKKRKKRKKIKYIYIINGKK